MNAVNGISFLPRDVENLQKLSEYADEKAKNVGRLSRDFANKGSIGLRWDSKVPDKDKWLFYFFTVKRSDQKGVILQMKNYETFFKELFDAVCKIKDPSKMSDAERKDPEKEIINKLYESLSKFQKTAKIDIYNTSSSALYKLHKSFVKQYEEMKTLITGAESVVLRKAYQNMVTKWNEANQRISNLEKDLRDSIDSNAATLKQFEQAMHGYESLLEGQKYLVNENDELREKIKSLELKNQEQLEEKEKMKKDMEKLWKALSELTGK